MKRAILIILVLVLIFSLTACDPSWYSQQYQELAANVVRVELISYDNSNAKIINDLFQKGAVRAFDFNKMEIIEVLDVEKLDDFLQDWSKITLWTHWIHSNSPVGISIRIIYSNDDGSEGNDE